VTRTWPVNGTFSKPQRELYEVVLTANQAARPPKSAIMERPRRPSSRSRRVGDLGCSRRVANLIKSQAYREFFMHKTGHWLGSTCTTSATQVTIIGGCSSPAW
jgi:Xaa-Pro aminopeptidase